jgi:membrane associated rhomboid family serine protease
MGCFDTERDWIEHQSVLPPIPLYTFSMIEWMNRADEVVGAVYRTNTFPLVHAGFFHAFMNIVALTPLLERFEAEYGTLTTLALFLGREYSSTSMGSLADVLTRFPALSTIPALLYTFVERAVLRMNTTVLGARYDLNDPELGNEN